MSNNPADSMPFSKLMGVDVLQARKESVIGELEVRPDLCTTGHILHGGAIMAFADALGGIAGFMNLPEGASGTITVESKTNFVAAAKEGSTVTGECLPVSVGKRLSVWQTTIRREDGKTAAIVTQTQMVL